MYLPLFFKSSGLKCLVVGGGTVAIRKIKMLCDVDCEVTVIAPEIASPVKILVDQDRIRWIERSFAGGDCRGFELVVAGTGKRTVNQAIFQEAHRLSIPVNVVDDPELCTVIFPAIHQDSKLSVAVSTGGSFPYMSAIIRDMIADFTDGWGLWVKTGSEFRKAVRNEISGFKARKRLYQKFVNSGKPPYRTSPPSEGSSVEEWLEWLESQSE